MTTELEIRHALAIMRLRKALEEIVALAGRGGPDEIEALNKIEAAAKAALDQR
jgi:hypothetical protein